MATKNPNAILRRIRSSVVTLSQNSPAATPPDVHDLIQAVKDLDNHLSWGGTPPDDRPATVLRNAGRLATYARQCAYGLLQGPDHHHRGSLPPNPVSAITLR